MHSNNSNNNHHDTMEPFYCPISREIMTDPVIATDGYTYEQANIIKWIIEKRTSPITGLYIGTFLKPNNTIRAALSDAKHPLKPLRDINLNGYRGC